MISDAAAHQAKRRDARGAGVARPNMKNIVREVFRWLGRSRRPAGWRQQSPAAWISAVSLLLLLSACRGGSTPPPAPGAAPGPPPAATPAGAARSARIASIRVFQPSGARPRFSPDGGRILFDRQNADGFFDLYVAGLHDTAPYSLSEGRAELAARHNGNGVFHPSGRYIVFLSEEPRHFQDSLAWLGNPGLGMYCNLWATDPRGGKFWKLTNHPPKLKLLDGTQVMGVVNPHFSHDGRQLIWTERYAAGGHHNWGKWRVMTAGFAEVDGAPRLADPRVLLRAEDFGPNCNYVTAMGLLPGDTTLLVAGNLDGQHEYGMDQYLFALSTRQLRRLVHTPEYWDEDAAIHPRGGLIVAMSNATSRFALDFANAQWSTQPREREYWLIDLERDTREQLTFFNDPQAPEYRGRRTIVAQPDFSPDGRYLAASMGLDRRDDDKADFALSVVLIEMAGAW